MVPTVTANAAVVWLATTETLAGTVMLELLLASVTIAPPEGAGADKVTVQFADPGAFTNAGEHSSELGWTFEVRLRVADWLWLLNVTVTVAF
jgi:hypothetical protein